MHDSYWTLCQSRTPGRPIQQDTFSRLRWGWVATASALGLLTYVGRALRWQVMLKPLTARSSFLNLMKATAIGFTAVVLFGRPGEFVRPYLRHAATAARDGRGVAVGVWIAVPSN